jgi:hypothetical protein
MSDPAQIRVYRNKLRERAVANARAIAGAGVGEDEILDAMNRWHLAVLEQRLAGGSVDLHLGMARHGKGLPFCVAEAHHAHGKPLVWAPEGLGAFRSPYFSLKLPEQQRWWCGIVWLEQNRGCPSCIGLAYRFADEEGWPQPKRLGELLGLGETLAPERGSHTGGPRLTRQGFVRG